jgi:hypothetical protein
MSEERLCRCGCGGHVSDRSTTGFMRGHRNKVLARQGVLAAQRLEAALARAQASAEQPPPTVISEKSVRTSKGWEQMICRRHGTWKPVSDDRRGVPAPLPSVFVAACMACQEEAGLLLMTRPRRDVSPWMKTDGLPPRMVEAEALAWIDQARDEEMREATRQRGGFGVSGKKRRYAPPAFREDQREPHEW